MRSDPTEKKKSSEVGGSTATGEGRGEASRSRWRWRLTVLVGAVVALLLATAVSSRSFSKLSISSNSCKCPLGEVFFYRVSAILRSNANISRIQLYFLSQCLLSSFFFLFLENRMRGSTLGWWRIVVAIMKLSMN
jgi:hypothetical protein